MQDWGTFAVISGSAAGALIGLLFVAVSIRIDVIARSVELRNRAGQTLILFVTALFIGILLSIPNQGRGALGVELIALAIITGAGLTVLDRNATADATGGRISELVATTNPSTLTSLLPLLAGVLLVAGVHWGTYVLVPCVLVSMGGGIGSAWLFLTRITGDSA